MDNLQVSLVNLFIIALWCFIIPCLSGAIYLLLSKSEHKQPETRTRKLVTVSVLALIAISLLIVVGKATIEVQAINPLCAGVGDPNQMMCFGRGLTPMNEAIAIINSKTSSDLVRTVGIPVIVSVSLAAIVTFAQRVRKARVQIFNE